jgi:hypothetical protein
MRRRKTRAAFFQACASARRFAAASLLLCTAFLYADAKSDLALLQDAYPGAFEIVPEKGIRFPDGTFIAYDDGAEKDYEALFENPDLQDMLSLVYPLGEQKDTPPEDFDPGRFRPAAFFHALYGKDEKEIRASLRAVQWMPSLSGPRLLVTSRFGVDKKLEEIIAELEELGPEYHRYLAPPGGSFNYRFIAGTRRRSAHSFGIAVDIAVAPSNYWRWEENGEREYKNRIPHKIVEIFERHGFIWGGKWRRFDTMHFEYRPEIILKAERERRRKQDVEQGGRI